MQNVDKKQKCPLCGAKNPPDASRCATCTRPLNTDVLPSQALYREALWAQPVSTRRAGRSNATLVVVLVLLLGAVGNYFWLGYGPDWMHSAEITTKGESWAQYTGQPEFRIDRPGAPMGRLGATGDGLAVKSVSVWVDANWDANRDANTQATGAFIDARRTLHAVVAAATTPMPTSLPIEQNFAPIMAAMAPGVTLGTPAITPVPNAPYGVQYDVSVPYTDWPDSAGKGTARARFINYKNQLFVAATFTNAGDDADLQARLVENFVPTDS